MSDGVGVLDLGMSGDGEPQSRFILEPHTPVVKPAVLEAFSALTPQEQRYLHHLSRASWAGGLICLLQASPEAPGIYLLLERFFRANGAQRPVAPGVSDADINAFLVYAAAIYANMSNYKSFGDTKFVPGCSPEAFGKILASQSNAAELGKLFDELKDRMYILEPRYQQLGLGKEKGVTAYFSSNCEESDAAVFQKFLQSRSILTENTRAMKRPDGTYVVVLASQAEGASTGDGLDVELGKFEFEGNKFEVVCGDYSALLRRVNDSLSEAIVHASNETEQSMIKEYISSFKSGSLNAHKDGSRYWIKDKGPAVETYIGFIETYRDPVGTRAEFEVRAVVYCHFI